MYYILEWMLASSIPHVDGACIWRPYFNIALYICNVCMIIAFVNFQEIKEIYIGFAFILNGLLLLFLRVAVDL